MSKPVSSIVNKSFKNFIALNTIAKQRTSATTNIFTTDNKSSSVLNETPLFKKSKFNFVIEYLEWVSIRRTLTGKLAVDGQNINYFVCL